eukprot:3805039-Prymnesium_polylepis.1
MKSRKRSMIDAPAGGEAKAARADGGSSSSCSGVPKAFHAELNKLFDDEQWQRQVKQLQRYFDQLQAGSTCHSQTGLLESALTGELPVEAWPFDDMSKQQVAPPSNANARPFSILQQFLRGKYDPSL